jgi:hypothetical protein
MEIAIAVAFAVVSSGLLVWVIGSRSGDGWWAIEQVRSVGEGVYRAGSTSRTVYRIPIAVRLAIGFSFAWSALTCAFFAPATIAIAWRAVVERDTWEASALVALLVEGIAFAVALAWTASSLLHGRSRRAAQLVAIWSLVHHCAVIWAFFDGDLAPYAIALCGLGIAHAALLITASMSRSAALRHQPQ